MVRSICSIKAKPVSRVIVSCQYKRANTELFNVMNCQNVFSNVKQQPEIRLRSQAKFTSDNASLLFEVSEIPASKELFT